MVRNISMIQRSVDLKCPECGQKYRVSHDLAHEDARSVQCDVCGRFFGYIVQAVLTALIYRVDLMIEKGENDAVEE